MPVGRTCSSRMSRPRSVRPSPWSASGTVYSSSRAPTAAPGAGRLTLSVRVDPAQTLVGAAVLGADGRVVGMIEHVDDHTGVATASSVVLLRAAAHAAGIDLGESAPARRGDVDAHLELAQFA